MRDDVTVLPLSLTPDFRLPAVDQKVCECGCDRIARQLHFAAHRIIHPDTLSSPRASARDETLVLVGTFLSGEEHFLKENLAVLVELLPKLRTLVSFVPNEVNLYLPVHYLNGGTKLITELPLDFRLKILDAEKGIEVPAH